MRHEHAYELRVRKSKKGVFNHLCAVLSFFVNMQGNANFQIMRGERVEEAWYTATCTHLSSKDGAKNEEQKKNKKKKKKTRFVTNPEIY